MCYFKCGHLGCFNAVNRQEEILILLKTHVLRHGDEILLLDFLKQMSTRILLTNYYQRLKHMVKIRLTHGTEK